jgi:hypothetical protein
MRINHLIPDVTGPFETDTGKLVSVQRQKYSEVQLCFEGEPWNIPFAEIKLHTRDRYADKTAVFPDCVKLGEEIVRRWNESSYPTTDSVTAAMMKLTAEERASIIILIGANDG